MSIESVILLRVAGWIICGVFAYALDFAYFQRAWPRIAADGYKGDRWSAAFIGLAGPIGLVVTFFITKCGRYGLKWK